MLHSTKGGSSDTEAKLLTVIPIWDVSAEPAVITAIPVGKTPQRRRGKPWYQSPYATLAGFRFTLG